MPSSAHPSVAAELYDERYYTLCEGYEEFATQDGLGLSRRLAVALELAQVGPGLCVLDLGCGRGEMLMHCAARGAWAWGLDYSPAAARIARETALQLQGEFPRRTAAQVANVKSLPFPAGVFDRVFMLDLVEHLYPWELDLALAEACRVLRDGGRLVVHTMPNRWYYRFGYPLFRLLNRLGGRRLPRNPRARSEYNVHVHVNEQDILRLKASLRRAGLAPRVWVDNLHPQSLGHGSIANAVNRIVRLPGLRLFLCNDLLAVATKQR
jgi:ubiquinone/menaquinone biosynthesis C-methylase UbiE